MSVINKILGGALLIGGLATTTGCSDRYYEHNTVDGQVKKMMSDRPYSEYQQATAQWRTKYQGIADAQNTLDSVGYRRVFESTQGVKDSAMVAEFNNIAASTRVPDSLIKPQKIIDNLREHLYDEKLADVENAKKQVTGNYAKVVAKTQHFVDSVKYNNFFKNNNLLNDSTRTVLHQVEEFITPISKIVGNQAFLSYKK